jgi:hemolysin III
MLIGKTLPAAPAPAQPREEKFSLPLFAVTVGVTLALLLLALRELAPALWRQQWAASGAKAATAVVLFLLFNGFVEYFFHRYVLHKPAFPGLRHFYKQHTRHHALTRIARKATPGGREIPFIENLYPITQPEQDEASFFPWFSLGVFSLLLTPLLLALQWLWPSFPWLVAGFGALTASLSLYELVHAIEHWPFTKWAPLIENPRWGGLWRRIYGFHLRHHAVIECNEGISGFLGLPLADFLFGTCVIPKTLYAEGEEWSPAAFANPRPCAFIRWCDRLTDGLVARRRQRAREEGETAEVAASGRPSTLLHTFGLSASIAGLVLLVVLASLWGDVWTIVSSSVFGSTLVLLYLAFVLHDRQRTERWKRRLLRFKRAAIFLVIAGTYTPFLLVNLRGPWGWTLLAIVWGLCGTGVLLQFFTPGRGRGVWTLAYLFVGWLAVLALSPSRAVVPVAGLWLLLAGGICYTIGTFVKRGGLQSHRQMMGHTFTLSGSSCHFLAVLLFVLPVTR